MNKEKLQSLFDNFLANIEKLESKKPQYEKWYDNDWKELFKANIVGECAELENDLRNILIDSLIFGEKK